jgi:hypothetical protein
MGYDNAQLHPSSGKFKNCFQGEICWELQNFAQLIPQESGAQMESVVEPFGSLKEQEWALPLGWHE